MATPLVTFRHGEPLMVDYTPGSAVTAGDVLVIGSDIRIAHSDIAANELGALAAGGGVYRFPKATGSGEAITTGTRVYWDASGEVATTTASTNKIIGDTVAAAGDDDATVDVIHNTGVDAVS